MSESKDDAQTLDSPRKGLGRGEKLLITVAVIVVVVFNVLVCAAAASPFLMVGYAIREADRAQQDAVATADAYRAELAAMKLNGDRLFHDTFDERDAAWTYTVAGSSFDRAVFEIDDDRYVWSFRPGDDVIYYKFRRRFDAGEQFLLSVDGEQITGELGELGLIFRHVDVDNFYYAAVSPRSQRYNVYLLYEDEWHAIIGDTYYAGIVDGEPNSLTIVADGNSYKMYINDEYVNSFVDGSLAGGGVGLGVDIFDEDDEARFAFDNFEYYDLSSD